MGSLGPYAGFILTAYALVALIVAALIASVVGDYGRQQRALRDLEAGGVTRRSTSAIDRS